MKITCIANSGYDLSKKQIALGNSPGYVREYLEIGKTYEVYGIILVKGTLEYLIAVRDTITPHFEPIELFKITDTSIPPFWHYNYFGINGDTTVEAVWGYRELALDSKHNVDLVERGERAVEALKIFYARKKEIDDWEKNKQ